MHKKLLSIIFLAVCSALSAQNIKSDSISMGFGYSNDIFYNLSTGQKDTALNTNWHIAFATRPVQPPANVMRSTTIRTNSARKVALYKSNFTASQWKNFDTTGYTTWMQLNNGDSSWDVAAFNADYNPSNASDYGWGTYNMNSHNVEGANKLYLLTIGSGANAVYKKIIIQGLLYDSVWVYTYANIDGTDSTTQKINKRNYKGKLFAYHNMLTKTTIDREPSQPWDLLFTYYRANAIYPNMPSANGTYNFMGILQAPQLSTARVVGIPKDKADTINVTSYSKRISTIGWDWKVTPFGPPPAGNWDITDSLTYFIKRDKDSVIYKISIDKFANNPVQVVAFNVKTIWQKLATGINKISSVNQILLYPNPTRNNITVSFPSSLSTQNTSLTVTDIAGKIITNVSNINSNEITIDVLGYNKGIYFISIKANEYSALQKFIVE